MKKLLISTFLCCILSGATAQNLIPVQNEKGKYGYADESGNIVIKYAYDEASAFVDGRAKVRKGNKWGYIGTEGKEVIKIQFSDMNTWNGNYCKVAVGGSVKDGILENAKWGIIDKDGKFVLDAEYDEISPFNDGLAFITKDKKYGYITDDYKILIPCEYEAVGSFNEKGFLWVNKGGKFDEKKDPSRVKGGNFGIYNREGKLIIPAEYKQIGTFVDYSKDANPFLSAIRSSKDYIDKIKKIKKEGMTKRKQKPGFMKIEFDYSEGIKYVNEETEKLEETMISQLNSSDARLCEECGNFNLLTYEFVDPVKFSKLPMPINSLIVVSNKGDGGLFQLHNLNIFDYRKVDTKNKHKIGIFDDKGNMLLQEGKYEQAFCPTEGFIPLTREKDRKVQVNYYDMSNGKLLFDDWMFVKKITPFENGVAVISEETGEYLIDKTGKKISSDYELILPPREGTYVIRKNGKYGMMDTAGKEIVTPSYNLICPLIEGLACMQKNLGESYGFLDSKGNIAISPKYLTAQSFKHGWASVRTKNGWGEIDNTGKEVVECKWNKTMAKTEDKPALMWVRPTANSLWYCLDTKTGQYKFEQGVYAVFRNFNHDFKGISFVENEKGQIGCIDENGNIKVPLVMGNFRLAKKAYQQMLDRGMAEWTEIDLYRFDLENNDKLNEQTIYHKFESSDWTY